MNTPRTTCRAHPPAAYLQPAMTLAALAYAGLAHRQVRAMRAELAECIRLGIDAGACAERGRDRP